jgi:hypothetical protein
LTRCRPSPHSTCHPPSSYKSRYSRCPIHRAFVSRDEWAFAPRANRSPSTHPKRLGCPILCSLTAKGGSVAVPLATSPTPPNPEGHGFSRARKSTLSLCQHKSCNSHSPKEISRQTTHPKGVYSKQWGNLSKVVFRTASPSSRP